MTITHVVTFTFKPDTSPKAIIKLSESLDEMASSLDGIESFRHGPDVQVRKGNADYAVSAVFSDRDSFAQYMASPEHRQLVTELLTPHLVSKSSVQF
ncbi:Dabb family protein [Rhodococcus sp. JVH1]|uniref:Dabb family protein n=1 Tax=Rhodococcus sp. JVH1 TaxID=745408 RepID=UPI0002720E19|nr:Dabb family protein [Rhodococcus sp. JVH1]EJI95853.1 stress responsive A/B Barrel domain protein [Rhodococcus sp. JVH1]